MLNNRAWMIFIGALQGILLLVAHELIAKGVWSATQLAMIFGWYAVTVGVPVAAELLAPYGGRRLVIWSFLLGCLLFMLGAYSGYASGDPDKNLSMNPSVFALSIGAAWFVALPFAAVWVRTGLFRFSYHELFEHAWRNALTLSFGVLFAGLFWSLLALWAGLFKVIDVNFFATLFLKKEFFYPATTIVFSVAVLLGHSHATAAATIRKVTLSIYRGLLPLLAVIALLFLLFLPWTGLQRLWDTKIAATLMMVTQVLMILFINAAYQDGKTEAPYRPLVRKVVVAGVIALPVYSVLTLYALFLRVSQYGWTGSRVWAMLLAITAALYAVGYMMAAFARTQQWLAPISRINVAMAWVIIAVLVLTNTPLLDPMRIGAVSQVNRLLAGKVETTTFDYNYLRFDSGRYGMDGLRRLAKLSDKSQGAGAIRKKASDMLASNSRWSNSPSLAVPSSEQELARRITLFPKTKGLEPGFAKFLFAKYPSSVCCSLPSDGFLMLAVDLDGDGNDEYVQLYSPFQVFSRSSGNWSVVGRVDGMYSLNSKDSRSLLEQGSYRAIRPRWSSLVLGNKRYTIVETGHP